MTERLFAVWPTPSERASLRAVNRARALTMFDVVAEVDAVFSCAACGAESESACTCERTGAVALQLVPECGCICHKAPALEVVDMFGRRSPVAYDPCTDCECP